MHGALLALSAFLPPKSILIELFPYAIPPENYTPYKTLSSLPSMNLRYSWWVNPTEQEPFNIGGRVTDGISKGLPESYRSGVKATKTVPKHKCCYSPFWIYRIFQDTFVDSEAIINLIKKSL